MVALPRFAGREIARAALPLRRVPLPGAMGTMLARRMIAADKIAAAGIAWAEVARILTAQSAPRWRAVALGRLAAGLSLSAGGMAARRPGHQARAFAMRHTSSAALSKRGGRRGRALRWVGPLPALARAACPAALACHGHGSTDLGARPAPGRVVACLSHLSFLVSDRLNAIRKGPARW